MLSLAFHILKREKRRFLVGTVGVAFAVVLMFMQFGFQRALFDSATLMHSTLNGQLVLLHPQSTSLLNLKHFSQRRLYQALACKNVTSVSPILVGFAACTSPYGEGARRILVLAFRPEENVFAIDGVERNKSKLHAADQILFDELSRKEFGRLPRLYNEHKAVWVKIENHKLDLAGTYKLGTSFGADGNIITSESTFFSMGFEKTRTPGLIDIGLVRLKPDANLVLTQRELQKLLPQDVIVLQKSQFIELEQRYWRQSTAIGFIFSVGVVLGLIVGGVIVYQILYAGVNDHLAEYATLKAIGYSDSYLADQILQEAIIFAITGFALGLLVSAALYSLTREVTGLPLWLNQESIVFVIALSILMCSLSGLLASIKLRTADPVECF